MDSLTHVGMDVHKESTAVALLRPGAREPDHRVVTSTPEGYRRLVAKTGTDGVVFCYEAGPCGYDAYRILSKLGARVEVIAPSLTPRRPGDRVKTDRLDARNLARLHRAGELTPIRVRPRGSDPGSGAGPRRHHRGSTGRDPADEGVSQITSPSCASISATGTRRPYGR